MESGRTTADANTFAFPWMPEQSDGTYRNPIIYADYSDPDVIRVGTDFYLVASSFNCTPGLPILRSKDLVNWRIIGHAVKNLPHARYAQVQPGCGIWAPSIRFHAGKFFIFFPMPDEGIYVTTADNAAGPWTEPSLLEAGKGLIDPCPFWDEDGQAYLIHAYAESRAGFKHRLRICPITSDGSRLLGAGQIVYHEPDKHPVLEGPKLHKIAGWYYILAPAGGVENGWQVALRSRHIYGPYEDKIVLEQGNSPVNGPHQGALVDTPEGEWWFVHFQDVGVYGRVVHLQPVRWENGWPAMGVGGEPVLRHAKPRTAASQTLSAPQTSDEFDASTLGLQWQWHANHCDDWHSLVARPGSLRLYPQLAHPSLCNQPNLLLQKFPARTFSVETNLELSSMQPGEEAGLVVVGQSGIAVAVRRDGDKSRIVLRSDVESTCLGETTSDQVLLRLHVEAGGRCTFAFADDGQSVSVPKTFQARKGIWIGAKVGLYSVKNSNPGSAGHVDVGYFRFK